MRKPITTLFFALFILSEGALTYCASFPPPNGTGEGIVLALMFFGAVTGGIASLLMMTFVNRKRFDHVEFSGLVGASIGVVVQYASLAVEGAGWIGVLFGSVITISSLAYAFKRWFSN